MNLRIKDEDRKQKKKLDKLKDKYDRDGVQHVEGDDQIGRNAEQEPLSVSNMGRPAPGEITPPALSQRKFSGNPARMTPTSHIENTNVNKGGYSGEMNPLKVATNKITSMFEV